MKVKCDYCGTMADETNNTCPNCGAAISGAGRFSSEAPQTVEQLKEWYTDHNLPPENVTRFFIGKDVRAARAFGIYRDENGDFIVYKNKSNGERAVRYRGTDEAYAVNELYQRLRAEISDQKSRNRVNYNTEETPTEESHSNNNKAVVIIAAAVILTVILALTAALLDDSPSRGYYEYNGYDYYYSGSTWYYYDDSSLDWFLAGDYLIPSEITDDNQYKYSSDDFQGERFEDSGWYDNDYDWDYDSDWDSDSDWDTYDSWDSYDMDWDSDW